LRERLLRLERLALGGKSLCGFFNIGRSGNRDVCVRHSLHDTVVDRSS
jgi:hypothetical protein